MTQPPRPFATAILKLTSVCNLACDYCYVFNLADRTHERVPNLMAAETAIRALDNLTLHVRRHGGHRVKLVLHGGEPTLWPLDRFRDLFASVERVRASGTLVDIALQTNGVRLRRDLVDLLDHADVSLGFSLDGPERPNDRHRVTHSGGGSYHKVMQTLERVLEWGFDPRRMGILSVADPAQDPAAYLGWATHLPITNISLLWPIQFSWSRPPWQPGGERAYAQTPRYGAWMATAFDIWWSLYVERLYVRQFVESIARIMGSRAHSDSIGNDAVDMLVVNTDGGIEYPDYLRAHRDGGARTPYTTSDELDRVACDPTFDALLRLRDHLPVTCRSCSFADVCGGGFLAGRSVSGDFRPDYRSVLCHDQFHYFGRVAAAVRPYIAALDAVTPPDDAVPS